MTCRIVICSPKHEFRRSHVRRSFNSKHHNTYSFSLLLEFISLRSHSLNFSHHSNSNNNIVLSGDTSHSPIHLVNKTKFRHLHEFSVIMTLNGHYQRDNSLSFDNSLASRPPTTHHHHLSITDQKPCSTDSSDSSNHASEHSHVTTCPMYSTTPPAHTHCKLSHHRKQFFSPLFLILFFALYIGFSHVPFVTAATSPDSNFVGHDTSHSQTSISLVPQHGASKLSHSIGGVALQQQRQEADTESQNSQPSQTSSPTTPQRLRLIHFNDVYQVNQLRQEGGFAQLKTMIKKLKAEAEAEDNFSALTVFSGDFLPASFSSIPLDAESMLKFLDALEIDFATVGNHDLDVPDLSVMRDMILNLNMKFLTSNVLWKENNQTSYFGGSRYATVSVGSYRVGLIGVLTKKTLSESPRISGEKRLEITDEISVVKETTRELYEKFKVDAVIVLSHLSYSEDMELARAVPGITCLLGGHDHYPVMILEGGTQEGTLLLKSGMNGQHVGVVDLSFEKDSQNKTRIFKQWNMLNTHFVKPDPEYERMLRVFRKNMLDQSPVIGKTLTLLDSRAERVRRKETSMGNLVTDVLRDRTKSDFSLIPGGSLRGNRILHPHAELRESTIMSEFPFHNHAVKVHLSAEDLHQVLEHGLTALDHKGSGRFPQISGLKMTYNPDSSPMNRIVTLESDAGERILRDTNSSKIYSLTCPDFLIHGGDGYGALLKDVVEMPGPTRELISTMVIDYIKRKRVVAPTLEGRIVEIPRHLRNIQRTTIDRSEL